MSVTQRSPTTRLIILAAFLLAAGLFAFRGYDTLTAMKSEPVGSALERELTYLLEPITGPNKVRVSVTSRSPKTVLVMIDGDIGSDLRPLRTRIETILVASIGFAPEQDTLTLSQFPFARGVGGALTLMQIVELTGLGLLSALLLVAGLAPPGAPGQPHALPEPAPLRSEFPQQARLAAPAAPVRAELTDAAALAEAKPNETANVVRGWMSYAED
jgi:flagellar biosynthesis/type III secretory pathway M-ring protein FliF/YscJ